MSRVRYRFLPCVVAIAAAAFTIPAASRADTLCVSSHPMAGCDSTYTTIGDAVGAAVTGDTVRVAPGTYAEDVHIAVPLSLIGAGAANTVIDATGLPNGIFIDGDVNPNLPVNVNNPDQNTLTHVTVTGFTVENANYEGILIANASYVTVQQNTVVGNDVNLVFNSDNPLASVCTDLSSVAPFETNEAADCGEGIHLTGVDHSIIADNDVEHNAGGILVSDDTGPTHDNQIVGNTTEDNIYDCGITLPSHSAYEGGGPAGYGVYHNTIAENRSSDNGTAPGADGAGVGIFASAPGTRAYGNVVIGNRLTGNGLPGVAMHSHTPGQNLNDNVISENYIAGNGGDGDLVGQGGPPTTEVDVPTGISLLGVSPNSGTVISRNVIKDEAIGVAVKLADGGTVDTHLNDFLVIDYGIANFNTGTVNGSENWWGCANGPNAAGCSSSSGTVVTDPFLAQPVPQGVASPGGQILAQK